MTMMLTTYLASLSPLALLRSLPGACAQGLIWGLLALGVYITYKLLDFADLTVDGSMATGGAVAVMLIRAGMNPWLALIFAFLAGMAAGFITGNVTYRTWNPGNPCKYPDADFTLLYQLKYSRKFQSGSQR